MPEPLPSRRRLQDIVRGITDTLGASMVETSFMARTQLPRGFKCLCAFSPVPPLSPLLLPAPSLSNAAGSGHPRLLLLVSAAALAHRTRVPPAHPRLSCPPRTRTPPANNAYSTCSPRRPSPVNDSPPARTRNLHVPKISITRSKHIHLAHTSSTRRAVLTRAVATDVNVSEKVQTPCDAPKARPRCFHDCVRTIERPLRPSARCEHERAGLPDSFHPHPAAAPPVSRARTCAHAMRTLRAGSRAI
ncbi:hypothetical protein B0H13DRAFT_2689892 [Mycena leptocephala]|nr:hypothetical protein B0H13DRAFT_2689892 [Mycena leptocephala]